MATTLRLPDELQQEVTSYARRRGLSVSGLVRVALFEYMQAHPVTPVVAVATPAVAAVGAAREELKHLPRGGKVVAVPVATAQREPVVDVVTEHFRAQRAARVSKGKAKRGRK